MRWGYERCGPRADRVVSARHSKPLGHDRASLIRFISALTRAAAQWAQRLRQSCRGLGRHFFLFVPPLSRT